MLVVWDWNGTLVDDRDAALRAAAGAFGAAGGRPVQPEDVRRALRESFRATAEAVHGRPLEDTAWEAIRDDFARRYEADPTVSLVPGAREVVELLARLGHRQCVVSQWPHDRLVRVVSALGLTSWFESVDGAVGGGRTDKRTQLSQWVSRRGGIPNDGMVMVGDTVGDARAGRAVGVPALVCSAYSLLPSTPEEIRAAGGVWIEDVAEVLRYVGSFEAATR